MYVSPNFPSKAALKRALAAGERVTLIRIAAVGGKIPQNGTVYLEGPHFPKPHTWYGKGVVKDGKLVSVS